MTQHLKTCGLTGSKRLAATAPAKLTDRSFHLFIDVRYAPDYWLHLAVPADESLDSVDYFLRKIWVECCAHLSAFTIEGKQYAYQPLDELEQMGMDVPLSRVLQPGMVFKYEYDFGTTTELRLKVVGFWERGTEGDGIELLARNDAPQVACHECGKQLATQICSDCQWQGAGAGWLCDDCADLHGCGSEMFLPVVNSPRAGVCGYSG
jgi:hypothetical protein